MSATMVATISNLPQLKGSLRDSALRLAYHADVLCRVQKAYGWLAKDRHISVSTAIRHVTRLVSMGIIEKSVQRLSRTRFAINTYRFLVGPTVLHKRSTSKLPEVAAQQEGKGSVRMQEPDLTIDPDQLRRGLRFLKQGSDQWQVCMEKIAALEALHRERSPV